MNVSLCAITFFLFSPATAQIATSMGARQFGMGGIVTAVADESSFFNNIGALAAIKNPSIVFAGESQSLLPGANRVSVAGVVPVGKSALGAGFFRFGDNAYSEQVASAGWSHRIGPSSIGIKISAVQYRATGIESYHEAALGLGCLTQITEHVAIAASLSGLPVSAAAGVSTSSLSVGIGITASPSVLVATEVEKSGSFSATWRTGLECSLGKWAFFRTGFSLYPSAGFFGVGMKAGRLKLDYAIKLASATGSAHHATCILHLSKTSR